MATGVPELDRDIERTVEWLKEVEYMLSPCDRHEAYLAWCAVVLSLRDQMEADAVMLLADQLPQPLRGAFLAGWRPGEATLDRPLEEYLQTVAGHLPAGFPWEPEPTVRAIFEALVEGVDPNSAPALVQRTPTSLRHYWPKQA